MSGRSPALAGTGWYPAGERRCADAVRALVARSVAAAVEGDLLGGIVPHAGWDFSGRTAAAVYRALAADGPERTLVVLGAVHRVPRARPALSLDEAWETPLGDLPVDLGLARQILEACEGLIDEDADAHPPGENSIELQTALILGILPRARFVPIVVPPEENAIAFGAALGRCLAPWRSDVAVVASTDLTHYGYGGWSPAGSGEDAVRWVKDVNDRRFLDLVLSLRAEAIVREARAHQSACGAGAVAAAVAAVREGGAREGVLLEHTLSSEVLPEHGTDRFVGYAAVVFRR